MTRNATKSLPGFTCPSTPSLSRALSGNRSLPSATPAKMFSEASERHGAKPVIFSNLVTDGKTLVTIFTGDASRQPSPTSQGHRSLETPQHVTDTPTFITKTIATLKRTRSTSPSLINTDVIDGFSILSSNLPGFTFAGGDSSNPPPTTIITSIVTQPTTIQTFAPLPVPISSDAANVGNKENNSIAAAVGGVLGGLVIILLIAYAIWHLRSRRRKSDRLNMARVESKQSHRDDPQFDGFRLNNTIQQLRRSGSWSANRSIAESKKDRDSIGMSSVQRVEVTRALRWAESRPSPPPPAVVVQHSVTRKPLPVLPVLYGDAQVLAGRRSSTSSEETLVSKMDDEKSVESMCAFDIDEKMSEEDDHDSITESEEQNSVRRLAPGQKFWAGLGRTASNEK